MPAIATANWAAKYPTFQTTQYTAIIYAIAAARKPAFIPAINYSYCDADKAARHEAVCGSIWPAFDLPVNAAFLSTII